MVIPRAIATQGFGRSPRYVAVQGLVVDVAVVGSRMRIPSRIVDAQRIRAIDDDDTMLVLFAAVVAIYGALA